MPGKKICVYCGASGKGPARHLQAAKKLGQIIGQENRELIYGGAAIGVMGALADAVLDENGRVIGVFPRHSFKRDDQPEDEREIPHDGLSELHLVNSMHERKSKMADMADSFVILPGGLGTMDETFEILTWRQLGIHNLPIVLVNLDGYWDPFVALVDHIVDHNYASAADRNLITVVDTVDDILPTLDQLAEGSADKLELI
jgi:hypothetical protein